MTSALPRAMGLPCDPWTLSTASGGPSRAAHEVLLPWWARSSSVVPTIEGRSPHTVGQGIPEKKVGEPIVREKLRCLVWVSPSGLARRAVLFPSLLEQ